MSSANINNYAYYHPSLADELLNTVKGAIKNILAEKEARQNFKNINSQLLTLTSEAHYLNAKVETIRDFIDNYYINDVIFDQIILNKYSYALELLGDKVENILDKAEKSKMLDTMKASLVSAYDQLYSTIINTNFAISHKISLNYLDTKSNTSVLQEA